jgi:adenylate cyclase class 2
MLEREVKIRVPSHEPLLPRLNQMGAMHAGQEQEINRILDTAAGMLVQRRQILRVRTTPAGMLTWKAPAPATDESGHKTRHELEVHIAEAEVDTLLQVLEQLGFREVLRYEKQRDHWRWRGVQIELDRLVFGRFVEIEGEAAAIDEALRLLDLQQAPRESRSYPELQRLHQQGTSIDPMSEQSE